MLSRSNIHLIHRCIATYVSLFSYSPDINIRLSKLVDVCECLEITDIQGKKLAQLALATSVLEEHEQCLKCYGTGLFRFPNKYNNKGMNSAICYNCGGKGYTTENDRQRVKAYWTRRIG